MADPATKSFYGHITGFSLADIIQIKAQNRYSGALTVDFNQQQGTIFFHCGEIIHAEQNQTVGEEALYRLLAWPEGIFTSAPSFSTTQVSIRESTQYLLLEAHRRIDETVQIAGAGVDDIQEKAMQQNITNDKSDSHAQQVSAIAAKVMPIPGVLYAVLYDENGIPIQDNSANAHNLAKLAKSIVGSTSNNTEAVGMGQFSAVVLQTKDFNLFVYKSRSQYQYIAIKTLSNVDAERTEMFIRNALT